MKLFDIIKKIFNIEKIDDLNDDLIDAYYNEIEKTETTEDVKEDEVVEEETVVENAEPVEEKTEEVVEEKTEEVVENAEPVEEETVVEEKTEDEEKKEEDVITKDVINNSKGNMPIDRSTLMTLHGKEFFNALYKNKKNLI